MKVNLINKIGLFGLLIVLCSFSAGRIYQGANGIFVGEDNVIRLGGQMDASPLFDMQGHSFFFQEGNLDLGSSTGLLNVKNPEGDFDAANKAYADATQFYILQEGVKTQPLFNGSATAENTASDYVAFADDVNLSLRAAFISFNTACSEDVTVELYKNSLPTGFNVLIPAGDKKVQMNFGSEVMSEDDEYKFVFSAAQVPLTDAQGVKIGLLKGM